MCGIAGIVARSPVNPDAIQAMIERMAHRGPDDDGIWISSDKHIGLGHRRLAILDPTARGHQPMTDPSGRVVITFNGEIYNYLELANRLRAEGATFQTGTDTEVLLQAYLYWGDTFVRELNGMFAFCLFDSVRQRILCARDRFSEKPFLYAEGKNFFAFASEYKALLALTEVSSQISPERIFRFLETGRLGLDEERETVFPAIRQLTGGEMLILDLKRHDIRIEKYWTLTRDPALSQIDETEAEERFRGLLFDSVKLRMRSDVELGSCLSGGLDSSAIVCIARQLLGPDKPYHVFSGRFPGTPADEGQYADTVVAQTGTTLHIAEPKPAELLGRLDQFVWLNELPVGSTSQYAQWCVFEKAREQGVTVLLDGQGADELLAGYEQYFISYLKELEASGDGVRASRERDAIRERYPLALPAMDQRFKRALPRGLRRIAARTLGRGSDFTFGVAHSFNPHSGAELKSDGNPINSLSRALEEDSFHAHLPALLRYGDRNSMAHSREVRLPFCDHRIAEFVLSLPPQHLMGDVQTKRLLRRSMKGTVPDTILTRWNKQGFLPPQDLWFSETLTHAAEEMLGSTTFRERGWWNVSWWDKALRRFRKGESHLAWTLWKPLIGEAWCRDFLDRINTLPRHSVFVSSNASSAN